MVISRDAAVALVGRMLEAGSRRDLAAVSALYAEDAVAVSPVFGELRGRDAIAVSWGTLFETFTDLQLDIATVLVDGDRVAVLGSVATVDRVGWFGRPPTGGEIAYRLVLLFTIANGLIVHDERIYDSKGVVERLEKARLDKELKVAADVQHALLPRTAQVRARSESVGASVACRAIGGDFFEFIDLASGDAALVLGDVSGKGPAAALLAAMIQGMLSVEASSGSGPADVVSRINRRLAARGLEPRFATLVYGVLSSDGRFVYTNAGHNPPLLAGRAGLRSLTVGGAIVGAFADAAFAQGTVQLEAGDTLVMFSDGVTEARNRNGDEFGEERLMSIVAEGRDASPRLLLDRILRGVNDFCDSAEPTDDITATVTRYTQS